VIEILWKPEYFIYPIGISVLLFLYALKLAILAKAPWAIIVWVLCSALSALHFTVTLLYAINVFSSRDYINWTVPIFFPMYVVIWCLPVLEWIKRLIQANTEGRRVRP
jgi:hypothetical protein